MVKSKKSNLTMFLSVITLLVCLLLSLVNVTGAWFTDSSGTNKTINAIVKTGEANLNVYQEDSTGTQVALTKSLPTGYTQLEYIESTGTQHIDTGVVPTSNMRFTGHTYFERSTTGTDNYLFVSGVTYTNFVGLMATKSGFYAGVGSKAKFLVYFPTVQDYYDLNFDYYYNTSTATLKSNLVTANTTYEDSTLPTTNITMFKRLSGSIFLVRFYNFTIYSENVLVRNFVPAKNSAGTIGMYDTVGDKFYTNAGTGTFTAGSEALSGASISIPYDTTNKTNNKLTLDTLPTGYTQMEYISANQSLSNNCANVELNVAWKDVGQLGATVQFTSVPTSNPMLWASYSTAGSSTKAAPYIYASPTAISYSGITGSVKTDYTKSQLTNNGFKNVIVDVSRNSSTSKISFGSWSDTSWSANWQVKNLFVRNTAGSLVRYLVPCVNSSGTAGFYDTINGVFYSNGVTSKTNAFTATSNNQLKLLLKNEDLGKSFGVRYKVEFFVATATGKKALSATIAGMTAPTSSTNGFKLNSDGWYYYQNNSGANVVFEPATSSAVTSKYLMTSFTIKSNATTDALLGGNAIYMQITVESLTV